MHGKKRELFAGRLYEDPRTDGSLVKVEVIDGSVACSPPDDSDSGVPNIEIVETNLPKSGDIDGQNDYLLFFVHISSATG